MNLAELVEGITKIDQCTVITENDLISDEHIDRLLDRSDLWEKMHKQEKLDTLKNGIRLTRREMRLESKQDGI